MTERRKLIEVALPLEAINRESQHEKSVPRRGHPATMHLWWARRPLAACRAVLFASLVDDPSSRPDLYSEEEADRERQRLFRLIEELVKWESTTNESVLTAAHAEIQRATDGNPPPVLDPFCGGGSIPLEAQRLGLVARGSDHNPVAVLITKALTEIPARYAGHAPCSPDAKMRMDSGEWPGACGLAEDVRWYGRWMREQAWQRIGHLYPKATLPDGGEATVIAWLWARTVTCPNPACEAEMPLVSSFKLATKKGKERWVRPIVDREARRVDFEVSETDPDVEPPKLGRGARFRCLVCGEAAGDEYVKAQGMAGRMSQKLMAVVAEGGRTRTYLPSSGEQEEAARVAAPEDVLTEEMPQNARWFSPPVHGLHTYADLFTPRQLRALITFADLVREARERIAAESGDSTYADAVATYLAFALDKCADWSSSLCGWIPRIEGVRNTFARQALPMVWDFCEVNVFSESVGNFRNHVDWVADGLGAVMAGHGVVRQLDAAAAVPPTADTLICTDPPYYDNIGYADLSDFFYVLLRRAVGGIYPTLFSTLLTPKREELIASPYRFAGNRKAADDFFERGLRHTFERLHDAQHPDYPLTLFYAFKQAESTDGVVSSTGWETMLTGLLDSGFAVTGTWPMRTERSGRSVAIGTAALASSIVLVCRPRPAQAPLATRRELVAALRAELPDALRKLQQGSIAPVDLAQAAIGPGMSVYSRYGRVVEADGSPMTVRTALGLINQALDEILAEQEGDFDADTRFAVAWFDQRGMAEGPYGEADVLARAKNTSVAGMVEAGVLTSKAGKVRLLGLDELPDDWDPISDRRPTAWEAAAHLTRRLDTRGEDAAADLLRRLGGDYGEQAKELAYRLYSISERQGWAQEAVAYNALVIAWPAIAQRVAGTPEATAQQELAI